ncbi:MAG TPA: amino acid ABC transporter substrate-binding protein [Stellaceae bacterium]|jgi:branched-chain amino acid transport system substrate-binding protein|nr:amino acid ABC transporter substrate-binding protein [Stellaceae bacterium]
MLRRTILAAAALAAVPATLPVGAALAADPIRIGFGMAMTGGIAANGKMALLGMQIWRDDINAKGGLLGRPVEFVAYDDQSNPSTVPGIYTKLLDVDKVDLVVSGYATNMIAPAMPVVMAHNRLFLSLFGLAVNTEFHYPKYFTMTPTGPDAAVAVTKGFFDVGAAQQDKPQTLALVAADAEYPKNASEGVRKNAKAYGWKIVYDKTYPPNTVDYTPIVRAVQATNPDAIFVASYPPDSVGIIRAANETGLKTKLFGGGMVGLQTTSIKTQLGPLLNGIVNYDFWVPAPTLQFPGVMDFLKKYQLRAASQGVDPLGYYLGPWSYAYLQILGDAVEGTKGLDQDKLADYIRSHTFKTVMGDIAFGPDGELAESRALMVQYQHVKSADLDEFKDGKNPIVVWPAKYKDGDVLYPYDTARK